MPRVYVYVDAAAVWCVSAGGSQCQMSVYPPTLPRCAPSAAGRCPPSAPAGNTSPVYQCAVARGAESAADMPGAEVGRRSPARGTTSCPPPPPTDTDTSAAVNINRLQGQSSKHGVRLRDPPPPPRPAAQTGCSLR